MLKRTMGVGLGVLVAGGFGATAHAAFVAPTTWDRGVGGNTYQHWDVFTDDNGSDPLIVDSTPDLGGVNANGVATLTETTGTPFLTGGGNIYSPTTATSFLVTVPEADIPAPAHHVTAVVQTRTLGNALDGTSFLLNGVAPVDSAELSRETLGGAFGGTLLDNWYLFNVPYAAFGDGDGVSDLLTLTFDTGGATSVSLDQLSIDTALRPFGFFAEPNPIPEPASLSLLALGVVAWSGRRRGR